MDRCRARSAGAASCSAGRPCPSRRRRWRARARSRSADGATIAALLPPSSSSARAKRAASRGPTARPMAVEPVAETTATRGIVDQRLADVAAADQQLARGPSGASPNRRMARANTACVASAVSGVFSDGFHTTGSPHTSASAAFHAHTATGKLNAVITPHDAERMPGLHHPVVGALGGDGQAVELARQADREVADVDHLLHFAEAFGDDLAGLERDQAAELGLGGAQLLAEQPHQLAAPRRRHHCARPGRRPRPARSLRRPLAGRRSRTWAMISPVIGDDAAKSVAREGARPARRAGTGSRAPRRGPMRDRPRQSSSCASEALARTGLRLGVDLAEAVREELLQRDVLLADEALAAAAAPPGQQVEHGADRGGGGDLDRAQRCGRRPRGRRSCWRRSPAPAGRSCGR